ncbi:MULTISPECIES: HAD family hydrolase [unclassified Nocardioides]|uniref:HAD family hydrolase n=1 Tax=unclassified Nocardioides TaxID=2615069 RepID=UPI001885F2EA|nr:MULTISPECIES: HAD family hydrolase [unclassified Nocardioides]
MPLIALDLDGTLVDQAAAARAWSAGFVDHWRLPAGEVDVIAAALTARRPKGEVFSELIDRLDLPTSADSVWADYRSRMPSLVTVTDADRSALADLRAAGWTLGVITNGMLDNQEGKIRRTGLDALVDGWVVSDAVGARKPAPAIFHALASRLGCTLEGWMIGDSLELDVAGGAAVGLSTAWLDDGSDPTGYRPDLVVGSVAAAARAILDGQPSPTPR